MFDRYDDHSQTTIKQEQTPGCTMVLVGAAGIGACVIGFGMAMAAVAAMIWAVVTGVIGVAAIVAAVLINRDVQKRLQAREYRMVELAARHAAGVSADAPYPPLVIDAAPGRAALPARHVLVNGRPREGSASSARRR